MTSPLGAAETAVVTRFAQEVPEVSQGTVALRAVARAVGVRTKVAVSGGRPDVDPVQACVGPQAERIQRISAALDGEPIDVLPWSDSPARRIRHAVAPANILRMELDPAARRAQVTVRQQEYAKFFGGGVRSDLAGRVSGWHLDVQADTGAA